MGRGILVCLVVVAVAVVVIDGSGGRRHPCNSITQVVVVDAVTANYTTESDGDGDLHQLCVGINVFVTGVPAAAGAGAAAAATVAAITGA